MNKKIKGIIISGILSIIPFIILIALIYGGFAAIASIFRGTKDAVGENATADEMLVAVGNEEIITDDMMNGWMVDRKSMMRILEQVTEYNNREPKERTYSVEVQEYWWELVPPPTPVPVPEEGEDSGESGESSAEGENSSEETSEDASTSEETSEDASSSEETSESEGTTEEKSEGEEGAEEVYVPSYTYKERFYYTDVSISENREIIQRYPVDWQLVYLLCVYQVIDSDVENFDEALGEMVSISKSMIEEIVEVLKPKFDYEFNPLDYWGMFNTTLSMGEVSSHPHYTHNYSYPTDSTDIQGGSIYVHYYTPRMTLSKVVMPWKEDTYVQAEDGSYTITTKYKSDVIMDIVERFAGERDMELFLRALDMMPSGIRIGDEIRKALVEDGYEIQ